MKFNKKIRLGVSILCLLLIFTTSISLIDFNKTIKVLDGNSLSTSALEDSYEPNNDISTATDITFLNATWLSSYSGNGTQLDTDYYMIYIPIGHEHIKVNVTFKHILPVDDINVRIWDDYNNIWLNLFSTTNDEYIDWFAPWAGYYYIEVFGTNSGNTYDLKWTTHIVDDMYEMNNEWYFAYDISFNRGMLLSSHNGNGRQHNDDWYNFTINPGEERLLIDLMFNHYEGDIDITLYDNSIFDVAWGSSTDDNEYINYVLPVITVPTTYYIKIHYGNQGNEYDLWFDIVPFDDPFEENDDWINATDLSGPSEENIWHWDLISDDDDWYKVNVSWDEMHLIVDVDNDDAYGYIEFEIFYYDGIDPYNNWIAWTDDTWIGINVPWEGEYYIHVYGDFTGNQYNLRWEDNPLFDPYEENDYKWEAYYLPDAASWLPSGPAIQQDDDWYMIYLDSGEAHVELSFSHMLGNIDLEVYYSNTTLLGGSYSYDDYESIDMLVPWSDWYYIKVFGANMSNSYDLWWSGAFDDYFEDNDDYWSASFVSPNYYPDLRIIDYDEDWFHLFLNLGDIIDIYIYFNHWDGDLELELYDPANIQQDGSYSSDDNEYISYTAHMPGDWLIRVYHASGDSRVNYDLDIGVNRGGDDPYEAGEDPVDAFDLTSYEGWCLSKILGEGRQFDIDWYRFDIGEGVENLRIEVNFDLYQGDIFIELFDSFNSPRGDHIEMGEGYAVIEVNNPSSGTYYIRVDGHFNGNWYDLYWTAGAPVICGDDCYEMNNDLWEAYGLWDDEQTWLSDVCGLAVQGDDDWYMIDVTPHFLRVYIELEFNFSQGDINLALYNDNQILRAENTTDRGVISINTTVPDWGEYYIQIWGDNAENEYDLWWDDIRTDFSEDAYEENDNFINATDLSFREGQELEHYLGFGVQYDQDWFEIFVTPERLILIVELFYDSAEGLMGFEVYDDGLRKIIGNFTMEDDDFIVYRLRSNGTYYIKVFGDNTGNVYNMLWKTKEDIPIEDIPGYDIIILLGSVFGVASIVVLKLKRSKFNRK